MTLEEGIRLRVQRGLRLGAEPPSRTARALPRDDRLQTRERVDSQLRQAAETTRRNYSAYCLMSATSAFALVYGPKCVFTSLPREL